MSYLAIVTNRFEQLKSFYGERLGFAVLAGWDRPGARSTTFDARGLRLELIDNQVKRDPLEIENAHARVQLIIDVQDLEETVQELGLAADYIRNTSWGARLLEMEDPDGMPVVFLQWMGKQPCDALLSVSRVQ